MQNSIPDLYQKMQVHIYFHFVFRINFVRASRCINRIFLGIFYEQMSFGVILPLNVLRLDFLHYDQNLDLSDAVLCQELVASCNC